MYFQKIVHISFIVRTIYVLFRICFQYVELDNRHYKQEDMHILCMFYCPKVCFEQLAIENYFVYICQFSILIQFADCIFFVSKYFPTFVGITFGIERYGHIVTDGAFVEKRLWIMNIWRSYPFIC